MTATHVELRPGAYADSVALLQVSRTVAATPGVVAAQVAMATPLNLELLAQMGFAVPESSPRDMVVALRVDHPDRVTGALAAVDQALQESRSRPSSPGTVAAPRTTRAALRRASGPRLALVSVPGASAAVEAADAVDADCDVMIFSDNVPVEQEVALKRYAADRGLLVMGPDCGTAVVGGVGLGFANAVDPGEVGIVAASGTGCQQLLCLLAAAGVGVAAALGVGGRDLSREVGGLAARQALARLAADPAVTRIVLVGKPPAPEVAAALEAYAATLSVPVTTALLGPGRPDLTAAAESLVAGLGLPVPAWPTWGTPYDGPVDGFLRGLFVGGTLCDEAMLVTGDALGTPSSNIPLDGGRRWGPGDALPAGTLFVDFGDDAMTQGRAHPMIDPTLRLDHLERCAADPATGVLLLDLVLGHGAEPDPAALLAPALEAAGAGRRLPVVVACVGTEADPQQLSRQASALAGAGAEVFASNAQAARRAVALAAGGGGR